MAQTIRLLALYNGNKPNTIITVDDAIATELLRGGINATTDLTGGVRVTPTVPANVRYPAQAEVDAAGNVVGIAAVNGQDTGIFHGQKTGVAALQRMHAASNPNSGTGAGTGNGYVVDTQRTAPGDFFGARLVFANYGTGGAMQINGAAVAVTDAVSIAKGTVGAFTALDAYSAGPNGSGLTWTAATFNGAATGSVPAAVAGTGSTANAVHVQPGLLVSDFIPITSVARADGSALPFLRTRAHISDNTFPPSLADSVVQRMNLLQSATLTGGHMFLSAKAASTAATFTTTSCTPFYYGGEVEPVGVIFYTSKQTRTLAAFGDSLTQGGNTNGNFGWPTRLNAKYGASDGVRYAASNWGVSGQALQNSLANCRNYCTQHKPHYATFFAWSPNNTITQATMDSLWADVLRTIDHLQQLGVTPVVLTSAPVNTMNAADAALWRAQNARVMSLPSSVIKVDVGSKLTEAGTYDGNAPKLAIAYSSGTDGVTPVDGLHWNNAGYELVADTVRLALR